MAETVILAEIQLLDLEGETHVLRLSDRPIRPFPPTDPVAPNAIYDDRLIEPPMFRRRLFEDVAQLSPAIGVGEALLANVDRALDAYQGWAWRDFVIVRWTPGTPRAAAAPMIAGLCAQPQFDARSDAPSRVRVPIADYRAELDKPLQESLYAGTGGYEGAADEIKGRPKPLGFGNLTLAHVPAPLIEPSQNVYQLNDGPISGSLTIFDRGDDAGLIDDGDLSGAAFDSATPAAAHYVTDFGRGLVKFNANPVGQVAFGFVAESGATTCASMVRSMLIRAGVPLARIDPDMATTPSPLTLSIPDTGVWFGQPVSIRQALAEAARGMGAVVLPDRLGVWRLIPVAGPVTPGYDHLIEAADIIRVESDPTETPVAEVTVGWRRVLAGYRRADLAPALTGGQINELTTEYRWTVETDDTAKTRFQNNWRRVEMGTPLLIDWQADYLSAGLLEQVMGPRADGAPRRAWRLTLELTDERLAADLGATILVDAPEWGLDGRFIWIGEEPMRPRRDQVIWTLWG